MIDSNPDRRDQIGTHAADENVIHQALAGAWRICEMGTRPEIWTQASTELEALTGASAICLESDRAGLLIPSSSCPSCNQDQDRLRHQTAVTAIASELTEIWRADQAPSLITWQDSCSRVLATHCTDTCSLRGALGLRISDDRSFTRTDQAVLMMIALATGHALGALAIRATSVPLERHEAVLAGQHAEFSHTLHTGPAQDMAMVTMAIEHLLSAGAERAISEDARIALAYAGLASENLRQFIARLRGESASERPRTIPSQATKSFFPGIGQEEAMLAIVREALRNSRLHARAQTVAITLTREDGELTMQVSDNGQGFAGEPPDGHFGLAEMRDLAGALGGELVISSTPGRGTTIRLTVPEPSIDLPLDATRLETPPHDSE